jgi:hypothetical protein
MAGDPIPAGEALAAPSAAAIDIAVCLLDVDAETQTRRLRRRRSPEAELVHHLAFATWMRRHATDPTHLPEVLTENGWPPMRWERWLGAPVQDRWAMTVLDTTGRTPDDVARAVARWCEAAVHGAVPVFRAGWYRETGAWA